MKHPLEAYPALGVFASCVLTFIYNLADDPRLSTWYLVSACCVWMSVLTNISTFGGSK